MIYAKHGRYVQNNNILHRLALSSRNLNHQHKILAHQQQLFNEEKLINLAGGLSLLIFPHAFVCSSRFYGSSLVIAPILTGLAMMGIGHLREKRGGVVLRIDMFFYAFSFAFGMALIRLLYTKV